MASIFMMRARMAHARRTISPLDLIAREKGPAMDVVEWNRRVDAHNIWANEKRKKEALREAKARESRLQHERKEADRRARIMGDYGDSASQNSLIGKIRSSVYNEQLQIAKDLIEFKIEPLIKLAIAEDRNSIVIQSHQLVHWKLISVSKPDDDWGDYEFHLPTNFQRFEYMLLDENLKLNWYNQSGQLFIDRSTKINSIRSNTGSIQFEITW